MHKVTRCYEIDQYYGYTIGLLFVVKYKWFVYGYTIGSMCWLNNMVCTIIREYILQKLA